LDFSTTACVVRPALKLAVQVAAAGFVVLGGVGLSGDSVVSAERGPEHVLDRDAYQRLQPDRQHGRAMRRSDNCHLPFPLLAAGRGGLPYGRRLCAILAAAFAGFLLFNYHPARIFHGRLRKPAGRLCVGRIDVWPARSRITEDSVTGFFYPALTFAYPIFDTALVSTLRKLTGRRISQGGRDHTSHRLASLGLDQRQVVWILWLLTAFGASLGIMIHLMPDALFAAGALLLGMLSMLAFSLARLPGYPLPQLMWLRRRELAADVPDAGFPVRNKSIME
jgi:hypothetical protein